jgi:hypothetical protein
LYDLFLRGQLGNERKRKKRKERTGGGKSGGERVSCLLL